MIIITKEFEKLKHAIKNALKEKNSNITDEELEKKTLEIAVARWKGVHGGKSPLNEENMKSTITEKFNEKNKVTKEKRDEKGRLIVAENVPIFINAGFNVAEENDGED